MKDPIGTEGMQYDWPLFRMEPPALIGHKCLDCGKLLFPATPVCTSCLGGKMKEIPFGKVGRLFSHTIVRVPMPGFDAPYAIGYIDLDEGFRLFSYILDWQVDELVSGKEMELVITEAGKDKEGNPSLRFAYRPKKPGSIHAKEAAEKRR